eukprot:gene23190-31510_t
MEMPLKRAAEQRITTLELEKKQLLNDQVNSIMTIVREEFSASVMGSQQAIHRLDSNYHQISDKLLTELADELQSNAKEELRIKKSLLNQSKEKMQSIGPRTSQSPGDEQILRLKFEEEFLQREISIAEEKFQHLEKSMMNFKHQFQKSVKESPQESFLQVNNQTIADIEARLLEKIFASIQSSEEQHEEIRISNSISQYICKSVHNTSDGLIYMLQNISLRKYIRIERVGENFTLMAADTILFSADVSFDRKMIADTIRQHPPFQKASEWNFQIEKVSDVDTLYMMRMDPPNDVELYDAALSSLTTCGFQPFPNYIMQLTSSVHSRPHSKATFDMTRSWMSPYGAGGGNSLSKPSPGRDFRVRVGIIDDFDETEEDPYPHGLQCQDIIEMFLLQQYDSTEWVSFHQFNFSKRRVEIDNAGVLSEELPDHVKRALSREAYISNFFIHLREAKRKAVNIINLSMAWSQVFPEVFLNNMLIPLRENFKSLNDCPVVIAAGNLSQDLEDERFPVQGYKYVSVFTTLAKEEEFRGSMVVVAATDAFGQYWCRSNYGSRTVAFAAPGECVTLQSLEGIPKDMTGTSAAAPHVTGALIALSVEFPMLRNSFLIDRLARTADIIVDCRRKSCRTNGRINITRALRKNLTGLYGILQSDDVQQVRNEIDIIQGMLSDADRLEQNAFLYRDKAFMGYIDALAGYSNFEAENARTMQNAVDVMNADNILAFFAVERDQRLQNHIQRNWETALSFIHNEILTLQEILTRLIGLNFESVEDGSIRATAENWRDSEKLRVENLLSVKLETCEYWQRERERAPCRSAFLRARARHISEVENNLTSLLNLYEQAQYETTQALLDSPGNGLWEYEEQWLSLFLEGAFEG